MKKRVLILILVISVLLMCSFASASWFGDFWNKITGNVVGNETCTESWTCTDWNSCASNQQTRTCTDSNNCGTIDSKPTESQNCSSAITCSDSDGGKNYQTKGTVTISYGDTNHQTWVDSCSSRDGIYTLSEMYCNGNEIGNEFVTCSGGCGNGACVAGTSCTESWTCGSWSTCTNSQQTRTCTDANNCGTTASKPALSQNCSSETPSGGGSSGGGGGGGSGVSSNGSTSTNKTCTDSDGGKNYQTKGTVTISYGDTNHQTWVDSCSSRDGIYTLSEMYCNGNEIGNEFVTCSGGCGNGVCVGSNESIVISPPTISNSSLNQSVLVGGGGEIAQISSNTQIISENGTLFAQTSQSHTEIKVSPTNAADLVKDLIRTESINGIELVNYQDSIVYDVSAEKQVKIIAVIPASMSITVRVSIEDGNIVSIEKPWWSFLATGD